MRPRLLDLFCCQGGASKGYHDAGFDVIGVDIDPQPRYPYDFLQENAISVLQDMAEQAKFGRLRISAIHASPPCQARTKAQRLQGNEHPRLIGKTRELLREIGLPYVIENVPTQGDDPDPLIDPIMLCGTMFGLPLYRHRLFECRGFAVTEPLHGQHYLRQVKMGRRPGPGEIHQPVGNFTDVQTAREAMEMPWANRDGLREAIPPAYTHHIGAALMEHLAMTDLEAAA